MAFKKSVSSEEKRRQWFSWFLRWNLFRRTFMYDNRNQGLNPLDVMTYFHLMRNGRL